MAKTILRAYNDQGQKYDLDVFNEEAFLLDISAIESGDIGQVFGISSQTFALPATNNNNEYFGNLYDLGADPSTSFIKTQPCQVLSDGVEVFSGNIYLDNVVTDEQGDTIYNAVVVNQTIDFKYQIAEKDFSILDWSAYNHDLTVANITSSWDLALFGGDIVYPLVEYGAEKDDPTATLLENGGGTGTFTDDLSPLLPIDFKPAIRLRTVIDNIFSATNYTYSSSFLDSAYMDTVYVLATQDKSRTSVAAVSPVSQSFQATHNVSQSFARNSVTQVRFNTEIYDNAGSYNNTTYRFTATTNGQYSFNVKMNLILQGASLTSINRQAILYLNVNGSPSGYPISQTNMQGLGNNAQTTINYNVVNLQLNVNDYVEVFLFFPSTAIGESLLNNGGISNIYFQMYQGPTSFIGGNVNIGGSFNQDDKLIDFLNGVIEKFNLVIEPTFEDSSVLSIEPFNTWSEAGKVVDWTDKVDRSVKWDIRHPLQSNPKSIYFSDEDDTDYFNDFYQNATNQIFGDYNYFSESDLASGTRRIGKYFAPTPMKCINGAIDSAFIVPQIYTVDNTNNKRRTAFKPRLLHYLGKYPATPLYDLTGLFPGNTAAQQVWWIGNGTEVAISQSEYPVFHHLNQLPATSASLDLNFGNLNHWEYHQSYVNAQTPQDAWYTYWAEYINGIYDEDSRILTLNIALKPTDIQNIRLNDKVFIDGAYYRINKISGANLTNEDSVKVELLKVINRRLKYPRRRIVINEIGEYQDLTIGSINDDGTVGYVDFETGEVITDVGLVNNASGRDGYTYYSGSTTAVWGLDRQNVPSTNNNGINFIDDRSQNTTVRGRGNTVGPYVTDSTIIGDNNNVLTGIGLINVFGNGVYTSGSVYNAFVVNSSGSVVIESGSQNIIAFNPIYPITEYDTNKVIIGNSKREGSQTETYVNVEVSASQVIYLTGSMVANAFHHHFQWIGGNGVASVYIDDATDPAFNGLQQRFTTNDSLTASKVVNLIPISGTIDGGAEEALTTPYDGMTAQIINGDWLIIQRKG